MNCFAKRTRTCSKPNAPAGIKSWLSSFSQQWRGQSGRVLRNTTDERPTTELLRIDPDRLREILDELLAQFVNHFLRFNHTSKFEVEPQAAIVEVRRADRRPFIV